MTSKDQIFKFNSYEDSDIFSIRYLEIIKGIYQIFCASLMFLVPGK